MFQSTHPRRVRLQGACQGFNASIVSIHAPTQGATTSPNGRRRSTQRFNPRTHAGCDHRSAARCHCGRGVSIHAPTQGATRVSASLCHRGCFNPRTHAGCDDQPQLFRAQSAVSIHAPTQGATFPRVVPESLAQFQSTHPRRVRRLLGGRQVRVHRVSIHAPTQGATSSTCGSHRSESSFNPRTHAGCDSAVRPVFRVGDVVSIHAPTQGATLRR